jgi:hypothetical protein
MRYKKKLFITHNRDKTIKKFKNLEFLLYFRGQSKKNRQRKLFFVKKNYLIGECC